MGDLPSAPRKGGQVSLMPMALAQLAHFEVSKPDTNGHFENGKKPAWILGFGHLDALKQQRRRNGENTGR
jgi:hypothetical protein